MAEMTSYDLVPEPWNPGQGTQASPGQNMGHRGKAFGTCQWWWVSGELS